MHYSCGFERKRLAHAAKWLNLLLNIHKQNNILLGMIINQLKTYYIVIIIVHTSTLKVQ